MTQSPIDERTSDEVLAERLVDEALGGMSIPEALLAAIRASMIGELLATPEGRRQLRRVAPDPNVSSSGDVAKPGAPAPRKAANASGPSGKAGGRRGGGRS